MKELVLHGKANSYKYIDGQPNRVLKHAGNLTVVYKGSYLNECKNVIVKKLAAHVKDKEEYQKQFVRELDFKYDHPNIPKVLDYIEQDDNFYIIKEYIPGIDLKKLEQIRPLRRKDAILFYVKCIIKVLEVLEELHAKGIVHANIRPANIIVNYNKEGAIDFDDPSISLIDFANAKLPGEEYHFSKINPFVLMFSAPEQVLQIPELINQSCDIYSIGISLFVLMNPKRFKWLSNQETIKNLQISYTFPFDSKIPYELYNLLRRATNKSVLLRPPNRYYSEELYKLLKQGQNKRIRSAEIFKEDLLQFMAKFENSPRTLKYSKEL